jgi:hypothetical protein
MFYLKTEVDGKMQEVDFYGDEIFTKCFKCGEEMHFEMEEIIGIYKDGGDLSSTSIAHGNCFEENKLRVINGGTKKSPTPRQEN